MIYASNVRRIENAVSLQLLKGYNGEGRTPNCQSRGMS